MCHTIVINLGEKEIETPAQFIEHFGFTPELAFGYPYIMQEACLCQIDISKSLTDHNIEYKTDGYDYYVGMLDEMKPFLL